MVPADQRPARREFTATFAGARALSTFPERRSAQRAVNGATGAVLIGCGLKLGLLAVAAATAVLAIPSAFVHTSWSGQGLPGQGGAPYV